MSRRALIMYIIGGGLIIWPMFFGPILPEPYELDKVLLSECKNQIDSVKTDAISNGFEDQLTESEAWKQLNRHFDILERQNTQGLFFNNLFNIAIGLCFIILIDRSMITEFSSTGVLKFLDLLRDRTSIRKSDSTLL